MADNTIFLTPVFEKGDKIKPVPQNKLGSVDIYI